MKVKVSVVIPNFNGEQYIEECLSSLMNQDVKSFEIIVVDDASTDESLNIAMKKFPESKEYPLVRYIKHSENLGFCTAVNDGIMASNAEYVLLLNNDTKVNTDFVKTMYYSIRGHKDVFSVSSKMISMKNPNLMDDSGDYYNAFGWAFTISKGKPVEKYDKACKVFAACGGAAIYRKQILDQIGLFDENHFAYLEDIDIGYRAKLFGYDNIYEPKAVVYHLGSAASGSRYNRFKARLSARNNVYLIYKNMPVWQIILNFPLLLFGFLIKEMFYITKGMGITYFSGLIEGLKLSTGYKGKKHKIQFKNISKKNIFKIEKELIVNIFRRFI